MWLLIAVLLFTVVVFVLVVMLASTLAHVVVVVNPCGFNTCVGVQLR